MYSATKYVQLGNLAEEAGRPKNGIVAACGVATHLLQVYCNPAKRCFCQDRIGLTLSLYSDVYYGRNDWGSEQSTLAAWVECTSEAQALVEEELKCCIARRKGQIAIIFEVAQALRRITIDATLARGL